MVVLGQRSFSLIHCDGYSFLIISVGGEDLRLLGGNIRSLRNDFAHDSSDCFDTQGKRSSINNDDVTSTLLSADDSTLNGSTVADGLVGIDSYVWLFSIEEFFN